MTQLAIIRAFSPYLLRSPKMVDSLLYSAYRYHSKTYDFLVLYSSNISDSDSVAHLCLILFAIRARPAQWAISCQIARLIVAQAWPGVDSSGLKWSGVEWDGVYAYHMDMDMDWTIAKPFCHLSLRVWVIGTIMRYNRRRYCCKSKHIVTLMTTKVAHITVFNCVPRSIRDSRHIVFGQSKSKSIAR